MESSRKPIMVNLILSATLLNMASAETLVVFDRPAVKFYESSPLGNGRLGAMVFGDPANGRIVLNESSVWSGGPQDSDREDAHKALPQIQKFLLAGENKKAQELLQKNFLAKGPGSSYGASKDGPFGCYQQFGVLNFTPANPSFSGYRRVLDLANAVSTTTFQRAGCRWEETTFVSAPDQVVVHRLTADKPGQISGEFQLSRDENARTEARGDALVLTGQLKSGTTSPGVKFGGLAKVINKGGSVDSSGNTIKVHGADEVTVIFSAGTDMFGSKFMDEASRRVAQAHKKPIGDLLKRSTTSHRKFYDRCVLTLPKSGNSAGPTVGRMAKNQDVADPGLSELLFNFGRYLMISSSRPDSQLPSNLQGIWAEELLTPWNGDFHININVQMNYWPAEITGLGDCHSPLLKFIQRLVPNGRKTARAYYNADGWVAHVITNPWLFTSPGEGAEWGSTITGGAWLCQHLFDHYAYSGDKKYLEQVYPTLKEAAIFFSQTMIRDPKTGWLVTAPSNSPENAYRDKNGDVLFTCMGPTIDREIVFELWSNVISAAKVLGKDSDLVEKLTAQRNQLSPIQVGKHGQVMEWLEDYDEPEVTHRHVSMLYGLYPGDQISQATPDLYKAARRTLERRGPDGTGWSLAWKVAFYARLGDGEMCAKILQRLLRPTGSTGYNMSNGGGTYANLFGAHPPFQIDSNFGVTAAIAEMLVRREGDTVYLLPALPKAWAASGSVKGLKLRGGITVDINWVNGEVTSHRFLGKGTNRLKVIKPTAK